MPIPPSPSQRAFSFARRHLGARAKRILRKVAGRPLVAWERRTLQPELSVVMPVYNVEAFLREALDSALTQSLHNLELIAVDDGSTDSCLKILREYERRDARVRVFTQANAGQGAARNVGVAHARAEFLTFVDSDDTVPPRAFEHMVATLRASGSDLCVGGVRRFRHRQYLRTSWQRTVHQRDRIGTTLEEYPAAMQDIIACNRVLRTAFWREQIGAFRSGTAYEDHVPMLAAYLRAAKFDILSAVTYNWRIREDSTGQQKDRLQNLLDRIAVKQEAHGLLKAEASEFVYDVWVARCLEVDFGPFVVQALRADGVYRQALRDVYRLFTARASDRAWDLIRVNPKVRAHLVSAGRWAEADEANQFFIEVHQVPPTRVVEGVLTAVLPDDASWARDLPPRLLRMAALESHFEGVVQRVRWIGTEVELTGWMRHRGLDLDGGPRPEIALSVRSGDREVALDVEQVRIPEANLWAQLPYSGCAAGGFRARLDVSSLPVEGDPWLLHGSTTSAGITSTGTFHYPIAGSSGARPRTVDLDLGDRRLGVRPAWSAAGFSLVLRDGGWGEIEPAPGPRVRSVDLDGTRITVTFDDAGGNSLAGATLETPRTRLEATVTGPDTVVFSALTSEFGAPFRVAPSGDYVLRLDGAPVPAAPMLSDLAPLRLDDAELRLTVGTDVNGRPRFSITAPLAATELGRYHQSRLQSGYRAATPPLNDAVLLTSYLGEFCSDSPLAIDRYLAEHRPDLTRIWGVADSATVVPDGARPVLIGSSAWYDAVGSSRYLARNINFGSWYRTRPEQAYLQTFNGYPFKSIGIDFWISKAWTPGQIRHAIATTNAEWDLILLPNAECEHYYREAFEYDGAVLVAGHPRTDALVTADAAAVRRSALQRIGVGEDKTVVLYAPTYRDTLTTRPYVAEMFAELDLDTLTSELGEEYVVLVRGHNNNQRAAARTPRTSSVVDVTDYPDVNDLILAADAAVLDYSSLRFDVALTGTPIVFFVPDYESYVALRPPLFSFEESSPGPWARTTAEVAAHLSDLSAVRNRYADATTAFNQRFNALHDGRATERTLATLLDPSMPWRRS